MNVDLPPKKVSTIQKKITKNKNRKKGERTRAAADIYAPKRPPKKGEGNKDIS